MARAEDRKTTGPIPKLGGLAEDAGLERAEAFRRATQRKGMPVAYGTGEPGVGAEAVAKANKIAEREAGS